MHTLPVKIAEIGYYLPEKILDNQILVQEFASQDWTEEKIFQKTGIRRRHVVKAGEYVSDLAIAAVRDLKKRSGFDNSSIDFLVLCTQTPDHALPATSCMLQASLGLPQSCMCFDFNQGCSGYVYGLGLAGGLIASGQARRGILVTSEIYSKWIHPQDRSSRTIFADGASATLLEATETGCCGMGPFIYGTDGAGYDRLIVPVSGAHAIGVNQSALPEEVGDGGHRRTPANLFMDGPEIFRFAVTTVPGLLKGLLDKAGVTVEEIDRVVFHQANLFMLNYLVKIMKLPPEKVVLELEEVGNTVSTSIPLAIAMAVEKGRIADGARLALLGFGVGYSWSGALVSWRGAR